MPVGFSSSLLNMLTASAIALRSSAANTCPICARRASAPARSSTSSAMTASGTARALISVCSKAGNVTGLTSYSRASLIVRFGNSPSFTPDLSSASLITLNVIDIPVTSPRRTASSTGRPHSLSGGLITVRNP